LDDAKEDHYETIWKKGVVQERSIDFPNIISYAPSVIDGIFGFRPEEHCMVMQRRTEGQTEEEFTEILHELALP
ncbi:hypothetical protein A2U01_0104300, partial [Trifolium medium]|nr:hypothetical protein [Trifolium medium]